MNDPSSFIGYQIFRASTSGPKGGAGPGTPGPGSGCVLVAAGILVVFIVGAVLGALSV